MPRGIKNVPVSKVKAKQGQAIGKSAIDEKPNVRAESKHQGKFEQKVKHKKVGQYPDNKKLRQALELFAQFGLEIADSSTLGKELIDQNLSTEFVKIVEFAQKYPLHMSSVNGVQFEAIFYDLLGKYADPHIRKWKSKIDVCIKKVNYDALIYYVVRKDKKDYKTPLELNKISDDAEERYPFRSNLNFFFTYIDKENVSKIKDGERII